MNVCADPIILLEQKTHHIYTVRITTVSQQPLSVVSPQHQGLHYGSPVADTVRSL